MTVAVPPSRLLHGTTAFFTFTTLGYAPFVRNLHASLRRSDPELAAALIAFCADAATVRALEPDGIFAVDCAAADLPAFAAFEGTGFGRVVSYKYRLARALLTQAQYAWWCDGDVVVRAPLARRMATLVAQADSDLVMQDEWPADVVNTGFWVARRSAAVDRMLAEMTEYTTRVDADDQAYFNASQVGRSDLRITRLDHDAFRCGNRFYYQHLVREPRSPMLHFNYAVGQRSKRELMMGHRCWYLDAPRGAVLGARARHAVIALGLRARINLAAADVGVATR
jgi:hypothetical protein